MSWIDHMPAAVLAEWRDAGRLGGGRFTGPIPELCLFTEHDDPEPAIACVIAGPYAGRPVCEYHSIAAEAAV